MSDSDDEQQNAGFLSAWSRRKQAVARAEAAPDVADDQTEAAAEPDAAPEMDAEALAALPSLDEIKGDTDLTPFLKPGVPKALQKAALRKVWLSNALIAGHDDPAVDYAWDWNAPEGVPGAGGLLNKDSVAKMVNDLINHARPDDTPEDVTEVAEAETQEDTGQGDAVISDASPAGHHVASALQAPPPLPQDPLRRTDQSRPEDAKVHKDSGVKIQYVTPDKPDPELAFAPPARRHGSAIPE